VRFLETFLLLDYLTGQSQMPDPSRAQRKQLYELLAGYVKASHPEHDERLKALKHVILQAPLRERFCLYPKHLNAPFDDQTIRQMLKIRNDLAHARPVDEGILAQVGLEARALARNVMRRELAARGINFGGPTPAA
jgi:hypothetical protein